MKIKIANPQNIVPEKEKEVYIRLVEFKDGEVGIEMDTQEDFKSNHRSRIFKLGKRGIIRDVHVSEALGISLNIEGQIALYC